jgi:hypothetical protein
MATKPFGSGAIISNITITDIPTSSTATFEGTDVVFFRHGSAHTTFTGKATLHADGSLTTTGSGQIKGGTDSFRGSTGTFTFTSTASSLTSVMTSHTTGTVSFGHEHH